MDDKAKALCAIEALKKEYEDPACSLVYKNPFQLLVATRLAAQCTDARVNKVTPELFTRFKTIEAFANADDEEVQQYVKSCGFYKVKAKDIIACSKMILEKFNGKVPDNMDDLISLPGVGRKTANLILGDIYKKPAVVVDTHCIRITKRLGFHNLKDAFKIEKILRLILPSDESNDFCHRLVLHGRAVCKAKNPKCLECCMKSFCDEYQKQKNK